MKNLQGAVFVDAGYVGAGSSAFTNGKAAVTPGFGVRYLSPVGPIRVDLGIQAVDHRSSHGDHGSPVGRTDSSASCSSIRSGITIQWKAGSGISKLLNQLALHLSIGQAF